VEEKYKRTSLTILLLLLHSKSQVCYYPKQNFQNMESNLTLSGIPGAGKSTVGIILAKNLSFGFIDTQVLIQINQQKSLQQIMDES